MFSLSNKQKNILKIAIPALILLGVILYFTLRKKPYNGSGNPTGVSVKFIEGYQTEYASGKSLALKLTYTSPGTVGGEGSTLEGPSLYTVECPGNKCPTLPKNPSNSNILSNMTIYVQDQFAVNSGDPTKPNGVVEGLFVLNADQFPSGSYFNFGIIIKNSEQIYGDAVYTSVMKVPDEKPGPVTGLKVSYS